MSPLTNIQKRDLAMIYRRAWALAKRTEGPEFLITAEQFRHAEIQRATGKAGLRCCDQGDYCSAMGHAWNLLGDTGRAMYWHLRATEEPRRQALAVLRRTLGQQAMQPEYAEHICRSMFKCATTEASPNQIWKVIFTLKNRSKHK